MNMSELLPPIKLTLAVLLWLLLCCVGPREIMRRSVSQHYRQWVQARAYWGRAYGKWVIGDRIFYTDEFWADIFISLVSGPALNFCYLFLLAQTAPEAVNLQLIVAAAVSTTIILFATRQYDRCRIADEEIDRRQRIDPEFSGAAEMRRLLSGDQKFVHRVIGRHAHSRTQNGD